MEKKQNTSGHIRKKHAYELLKTKRGSADAKSD